MPVTGKSVSIIAALLLQATRPTAEALLRPWGGAAEFPSLYGQSVEAFFSAEQAYRKGEYARCSEILDAFWRAHPAGKREWGVELQAEEPLTLSKGLNFGRPVCYYGLRMLTECARYRRQGSGGGSRANPVRMTVLLVGQSTGGQPSTAEELRKGTGRRVHHTLEPSLASSRASSLASRNEIFEQSLYLFGEYVGAMTDGHLRLEWKVVRLPDLDIPVEARETGDLRFAGLGRDAMPKIWNAVDEETRRATDWWWVLYPSHVPEQYPEFKHAEFITGGMAVGPDGRSPAFLIDDRWLVRVAPHHGSGPMTEAQRRAYLPQWLQHEFFHHLYRTYPGLKLEAADHQWFDRKTWPADFEGFLEPDYYAESLQKRLRTAAPSLHVALRYAQPSREVLGRITPEMLRGKYEREPVQNDWHRGVIDRDTSGTLRWTNVAGKTWTLQLDAPQGVLQTGAGNPYRQDAVHGRVFRIELRRDGEGNYVAEVAGFRFNGELYRRMTN